MAPPLVPPPILRPARPHRGPASCRRRRMVVPGLVPAPATLAALDQATKLEPAAALAVALERDLATLPELDPAEVAPVEVTNLAQVLVTLTAPVPAINPAEVMGTKNPFESRFGGE